MAPIKFEEHVKEKLDGREIKPSAESWEKLNSRLDNAEKKPVQRWWVPAVAAVGVLLIASIFFLKQQGQDSLPVVESPVEKETRKNNDQTGFEPPVHVASEEENNKDRSKNSGNIKSAKPVVREQVVASDTKESGYAAKNSSDIKQTRKKLQPVAVVNIQHKDKQEMLFSEKMRDLIAEVSEKQKLSGKKVTEAEVDALLAQAAREISEMRGVNNVSGVAPEQLLAEAEEEIYESFKSKIFNVLKDGYQKAVIAVSNRTGPPQEYK
ncbi:hypothetical protein GCM10023115_42880 [Pontixanthobacter gangjinensis]|uniref:Uncharacterized protein n=1 Tax=Christiangramia aestuarii TaxID=1028746 RepID=A0A7M3SYD9_9FLAO|nr:hypothetical protein [Christiangramia aestuarii]MUP41620.1 hypothetical protein [Christiangramia aestuarii]